MELADRGVRVALYDKSWPPRGASWAAAGMLAPAFEAAPTPGTHRKLYELCDASAKLWPVWAKSLQARTGIDAGYHPGPSLAIATNAVQAQSFEAVLTALSGRPNAPRDCTNEVLELEPAIVSEIKSALLLPSDGQADNRQTVAALVAAVESHANITIRPGQAPLKSVHGVLDHAEELVTRARKVGLSGLAIADKNTFAGIVRGHSAAKELGLRYLVATRLVLMDGTEILAYPRNRKAFGQLSRLLTLGKRRTVKGDCELHLEDVLDYAEHCILIGLKGPDFATTLGQLKAAFDDHDGAKHEISQNGQQYETRCPDRIRKGGHLGGSLFYHTWAFFALSIMVTALTMKCFESEKPRRKT